MGTPVEDNEYRALDKLICEIKRQIDQKGGYPFNSRFLRQHLSAAAQNAFVANVMHFLRDESIVVRVGGKELRVQLMQCGCVGMVSPQEKIPEMEILRDLEKRGFRPLDAKELQTFMMDCGIARYFNVIGMEIPSHDNYYYFQWLQAGYLGDYPARPKFSDGFPCGTTFAVTPGEVIYTTAALALHNRSR